MSLCKTAYPVLDSLMRSMLSSDLYMFLSMSRLKWVLLGTVVRRYTNLYRDIPKDENRMEL